MHFICNFLKMRWYNSLCTPDCMHKRLKCIINDILLSIYLTIVLDEIDKCVWYRLNFRPSLTKIRDTRLTQHSNTRIHSISISPSPLPITDTMLVYTSDYSCYKFIVEIKTHSCMVMQLLAFILWTKLYTYVLCGNYGLLQM